MKVRTASILSLALLVAATIPAAAAEIDTSHIRVKKAIADTMTPDELQAYKERLAVNLAGAPPAAGMLGLRAPGDTCDAATYEIATLPFGPSADTTAGATDDYDLPPDETDPTCTAAVSCTGTGPAMAGPRGAVYGGTGTGPDRAFRIRTDADCTLSISMTPTDGDDMALIAYLASCSSSLADCACVSDTAIGGGTESISLDAVADTDYFVVVDGYSTAATPPGPSGPFTLSITGTDCGLVPVELQGFFAH